MGSPMILCNFMKNIFVFRVIMGDFLKHGP
mgnify:CR=1 FL=1